MSILKFSKKTFLVFILLLAFNTPLVSAQDESTKDIIINSTVSPCILYITVKPEKRIPAINNWDTFIDMDIYRSSNSSLLVSLNTPTNIFSKATLNLCDQSVFSTPGNYNFYIKGTSTLRKAYSNISTFNNYENFIDFSAGNSFLLAGETSNVFDNYINSLDLSTQIKNIYTNSYKNDLNQDGSVNSLDFSITITNFFKSGD